MAENGSELRRIVWSQAFPFVRLFHTLRLALNVNRLILALACVVLCYLGGRVLDLVWPAGRGVVTMPRELGLQTEIEAYAALNHAEFRTWLREARRAPEQRAFLALLQAGKATNQNEAQQKLAAHSLRELLMDAAYEQQLAELQDLVDERLKKGLAALDKSMELPRAERRERRRALIDAADTVQMMLRGKPLRGVDAATAGAKAIETLVAADPQIEPRQRSEDQGRLTTATARQVQLQQYEALRPRGPFISLLTFELRCFAAAIQGVCSGRWGFSGRALDPEPAMCGSIESALRGVCWLVNQRPWYALLFGVFNLLVFAYFGGAICRSAAVQSAREESISMGEALKFVRGRFGGFVLAPLLPVAVFIGVAVLMFLGGLFGIIPYIGELVTGLFYPLALLGGCALAILVLATVLGFHLMWPTIAVEGSDGFDALSRACSYVGSRIWHVGFYAFVLLLYGGASFVLLRVVAVLVLKLSHKFTGVGLNLISSSALTGVGKLDGMWSMPAWADLSLLPSTSDVQFWGTIAPAPLDGAERVSAWLIGLWVYLVVSLLAAFVVSYFFCGSTQMYFLLRRDVDATDWDEVYYEEVEEEAPAAQTPAPAAAEAPGTGSVPPASPAPSEADQPGDAGAQP